MEADGLPLRGPEFFTDHAIDLRLGARAVKIDSDRAEVLLGDGERLAYDRLILATGAKNRRPPIPGLDCEGVFFLRDIADAIAVKRALGAATHVVVVGAGFIGLEIAATARALGKETVIVEIADRPMSRALSPAMSAFFKRAHDGFGATFRLGVGVTAIEEGPGGRGLRVVLNDGSKVDGDVVVVGAGVLAEDTLAAEAGLACQNGVVVDAHLRTSDENIFAIGDCANFPNPNGLGRIRLESVQNAVDQAREVARTIVGKGAPYRAVPWFWSDQGDLKLQIAGIAADVDRWVMRGTEESGAFSLFGYRGDQLVVVESVNRGGDHAAARRFLAGKIAPTADQAADMAFDLRKLALTAGR